MGWQFVGDCNYHRSDWCADGFGFGVRNTVYGNHFFFCWP
jgi:hypothetical protein